MTIRKAKRQEIEEIYLCPMSERLYKIVGYTKDGQPITRVVEHGEAVDYEQPDIKSEKAE